MPEKIFERVFTPNTMGFTKAQILESITDRNDGASVGWEDIGEVDPSKLTDELTQEYVDAYADAYNNVGENSSAWLEEVAEEQEEALRVLARKIQAVFI